MSALREFFNRYGLEMAAGTIEHMQLVFLAMLIAASVAMPLGIFLARCRWRSFVTFVMGLVSVIQPIPSLALVAFTLAILLWLNSVLHIDLPAIGTLPGLVALVAYAILPILRNTYTGIRQVDDNIIEVARGMGMTRRQLLLSVELPVSVPFIMTGVRISTVWTIGVGTLVSLVGAGGLGDLIFKGLYGYKVRLILAGAVPAAALALVFDWILGAIENWLTPRGLREK